MPDPSPPPAAAPSVLAGPPNESLGALFVRFLRFGALAWGGPVAQIALIRDELVERERWISRDRFNRVLAVYQALPGPEAHELCVYFGMLARGRTGAVLAGLGFMLPGLVLMLALSWGYVRYGLASPLWQGAMLGCSGAVAALVVRAVVRIGAHALGTPALWLLMLASAAGALTGANGVLLLAAAGLTHGLWQRLVRTDPSDPADTNPPASRHGGVLAGAPFALFGWGAGGTVAVAAVAAAPTLLTLFLSGLKAGLLTFGGAYTAIPFLQRDAVDVGRWMTNPQFLDGLALSAVVPAPFVIFSTFVGYLGGGIAGALLLTAGIFLPAFSFTLLGHDHLERVVEAPATHAFLDGVMAGVVGIVAVTAFELSRTALVSALPVVIFAAALLALFRLRAPTTVAWVMGSAALLGVLVG